MLHIALAQLDVTPGRPDLNTASMLTMIASARENGVKLIIFPEMAIPGYLLGDLWEQSAFLRDCETYGQQIIAASEDIGIIFGNVAVDWDRCGDDGRVRKYNACFTAYNGRLIAPQGAQPYPYRIKTLHPNYREFDDTRHFYSLRKLACERDQALTEFLQPTAVPFPGGDIHIGCVICEDGWNDDYPVNPLQILQNNGPVDIFVNISSSPYTLGKNNKRNRVFSRQASSLKTPLIYVNKVGLQNNGKTVYTFDGFSTVYDSSGQIIAHCTPFQETLRFVALPLNQNENSAPSALAVPPVDDTSIETIYRAVHYGTKKFLAAIGMSKVVIGVSGGIDSAVAAALYTEILGPDNVLLINMPSRFNSSTTRDLALQLAKNLGCQYTVMPIQEAVENTVQQIQSTPILHFSAGKESRLTVTPFILENIQARDRSSRVLAAAAAAFGGGFTCNANKTELTVGYSTLYGDQSGFFAALADLWKHQIYALADYLNQIVYQREVIPRATIEIIPSAELSADQSVDEGKGDPLIYPYHDYLFRAFMEFWNRSTPEDVLLWYQEQTLESRLGCEPGLLSRVFPSPREFITDLERWWQLYAGMGVAKRIQAPPVLAVSRRAYGFDHRESQNTPYYTLAYRQLKEKLLAEC
ncbi:MAG TPA: NAD(+) synthase [Patescibacteria group bacterium]|nr:NAD(+) synthase [Patescibacteria group bacterium]